MVQEKQPISHRRMETVLHIWDGHSLRQTGSNQYKLRVKTGEHYDANGFGKIGDRYVIACTPTSERSEMR